MYCACRAKSIMCWKQATVPQAQTLQRAGSCAPPPRRVRAFNCHCTQLICLADLQGTPTRFKQECSGRGAHRDFAVYRQEVHKWMMVAVPQPQRRRFKRRRIFQLCVRYSPASDILCAFALVQVAGLCQVMGRQLHGQLLRRHSVGGQSVDSACTAETCKLAVARSCTRSCEWQPTALCKQLDCTVTCCDMK